MSKVLIGAALGLGAFLVYRNREALLSNVRGALTPGPRYAATPTAPSQSSFPGAPSADEIAVQVAAYTYCVSQTGDSAGCAVVARAAGWTYEQIKSVDWNQVLSESGQAAGYAAQAIVSGVTGTAGAVTSAAESAYEGGKKAVTSCFGFC